MVADTDTRPVFCGNAQDLAEFSKLVASPVRSEAREMALHAWQAYKLARQASAVRRGASSKRGPWSKGEYIRSLTTPAIDLRGAYLEDVIVGYADLRAVRLDGAQLVPKERAWIALKGANFEAASLRNAELRAARLMEADLRRADLRDAKLIGADLSGANLRGADLRGAQLQQSDLRGANLTGADLRGTDLRGSRVYGVSAWDTKLDGASRHDDLIVTPDGESEITVDNIEVAQFVYLLLSNPRIRGVIDTVCRKGVLILGRFTTERKAVLDALRDELRHRNLVPMIFDFDKPSERDFSETVRTLAGMSRFIIADITNPKSSPLELQAVVPDLAVPLVPILASGEHPFAMFADLRKYSWVLDPLTYTDADELIRVVEPAIIQRALAKHAELLQAKAREVRVTKASDYLLRQT